MVSFGSQSLGIVDVHRVNGSRKLISWRQVKIDHLPGLGFVGRGGGDAAEVSVFESVAVAFEGHQRNAKLQLTVLLSPPGPVPGLYLHPDHRRRRRRLAVRSDLSV